ncbi:MAG: histidine kinase, partial [Lachnospiraceae bacterium]|nr:histidine kinase [Lachnospiraceae bacterium]
IVMMVGALLMTLVLSNVLTEPILRIIQATTRISGGDFSPDPALESDDEIGSMGKSINSLAANMAEMVVRVREEERNKKELEYRILQNQINPHFVYNVLNSIKVMAQLQGADNICKLIDSFGGLLKEVSKGVNDRVTVREEFDLAEKFVFIHKLRRKGLIESSYVIEPGCEDCLVIKFLLQPLLENAIIHGFEGKHGMGELIIEAHKAGQNLELSILDNGIGMTQEEIDALLEGKTGKTGGYNSIGVQNVQEHIRMMYGEEYGIHYSSVKGEYTRVTVLVPLEYAEETVEVQDHV